MITPKLTFQKDKAKVQQWSNIADSALFHEAAQAALAQMAMNNNAAQDMASATALHFRIEGAKQFLATMMSLSTVDQPRKPLPSGNLKPV